jgi:hypothetical protein
MKSRPPDAYASRKSSWPKKDRDVDKAAKKAAKQERKRKKGGPPLVERRPYDRPA